MIDRVQRIVRIDFVDRIKRVVRVDVINRIYRIPGIDAVDRVEWILRINEHWFTVRLWGNPHSVLARVQEVLSRVQTGKCALKRTHPSSDLHKKSVASRRLS